MWSERQGLFLDFNCSSAVHQLQVCVLHLLRVMVDIKEMTVLNPFWTKSWISHMRCPALFIHRW